MRRSENEQPYFSSSLSLTLLLFLIQCASLWATELEGTVFHSSYKGAALFWNANVENEVPINQTLLKLVKAVYRASFSNFS